MAVNDWYARQFGERDHIAINFSLSPDPHPAGDLARDATWGGFSLWVRGRCLTSSVSTEGGFSEEIRWNLLEILEWLAATGIRLVNEETQPLVVPRSRERDACDWLSDTEQPPATFTAEQETGWFEIRSEWRRHHALRSAAVDLALPNVVFRRLGESVEVSWDNETWSASRPGLRFVERRGTERITAVRVAEVVFEALGDCARALANKFPETSLLRIAEVAATQSAADSDWRWLIHDVTAKVIDREMGDLRALLTERARECRKGLYVPHCSETLVLRSARLKSAEEVSLLLRAALAPTQAPIDPIIEQMAHRGPPPLVRPYLTGYDAALEVRETLGWGDAPAPNLDQWMTERGIGVSRATIAASVDLVTARIDDHARVAINPSPSSHLRRETAAATALGHLLMDSESISVDGLFEHWPTSARARAFGIMLLLPKEGMRRALAGRDRIEAEDVREVMDSFGTGPYATTHHLKNLSFIDSDERRDEILRALVA